MLGVGVPNLLGGAFDVPGASSCMGGPLGVPGVPTLMAGAEVIGVDGPEFTPDGRIVVFMGGTL